MRVLILRPEPQASATAAELAELGFEPLLAPMLALDYEEGVAERVLAGGDVPAALVLTSANGAEALRRDERYVDLLAVPVVAVGDATATAARAAGFVVVISAGGDSAAVVDLVARRFAPGGGRIVHVAGRDRAGDVAGGLAAQGFEAETIEAYRAEPTQSLDPELAMRIGRGDIEVAVVASARTAEAFRRSLRAAGLEGPFERPVPVVISMAAAEPLRDLFSTITVADQPDGEGLTKAVVALRARLEKNAPPVEEPDRVK